jgi:Fe2+ or Zn2+ uptake regulation protein
MGTLLDRAIQRLRSQGGRVTPQRRHIIETVESLAGPGHPTAEQIYQQAQQGDPALNLATVYRTLRWLERERFINPQRFGGEQREDHFDLHQPADHHHFVCDSCKRVIEFTDSTTASLVAKLQKRLHVRVDSATLLAHGLCDECQAEQNHAPSDEQRD